MATVSKRWAKLLSRIPGYDPIATAGACHFDAAAAQRALTFFPDMLRHCEGEKAREPFTLEPWEAAIVANLFGWKRPDGTRRYREVLVFIPRKNGKTPLAAGLLLALLCMDDEPGAQLAGAAAAKDQAKLVFRHATGMVAQEPALASRMRCYRTHIEYPDGPVPSVYRVLSADADVQHGLNLSGAVIDELHAQGSDELVAVIKQATASRRQPIVVYLTTAGDDMSGICGEKYEYFCKIRDGIIADDAALPVIYEAPKDAAWDDPATWRIANPNLGVSVRLDYLEREAALARANPRYEAHFRRFHLNTWVATSEAFLRLDAWDANAGSVNWRDLRTALKGRRCFGGLDLATTTDLASFALVFPPGAPWSDELSRCYCILQWSWMPEETAHERTKRGEAPYDGWSRSGLLELTEGTSIDYSAIRERVNALAAEYDIADIGYDPYNANHLCSQQLGVEDGLTMVAVRQGMLTMSGPTKQLEILYLDGKLRHGGDPLLRWCATNAAVRTDGQGNIMLRKYDSSKRIDPLVAVTIALSRAQSGDAPTRSVYEDHGILFV